MYGDPSPDEFIARGGPYDLVFGLGRFDRANPVHELIKRPILSAHDVLVENVGYGPCD